jgi:hypothetical protein
MQSKFVSQIVAMVVGGLLASIGSMPSAAQVNGSGSTNFIPRWTSSTTLGNSILFQTNSMVGIGSTTPAARLGVVGQGGVVGVGGGNAPAVFQVLGGKGATNSSIGLQGAGASVQIVSGTGAP